MLRVFAGVDMRKRNRLPLLPDESLAQLRARLRRFVLGTRDDAPRSDVPPFPEHATVLTGPSCLSWGGAP